MDVPQERPRGSRPPSPITPRKRRIPQKLSRERVDNSSGRSREAVERRRGSYSRPSTPSGRPRRARARSTRFPGGGKGLNNTHTPIRIWANLRPPAHRSVTSVPQHPPWYSVGGPYTLEARHISATSIRTLQPGNETRPSTNSAPQARGRAEMQMITRTSCNPCAHTSPGRTR